MLPVNIGTVTVGLEDDAGERFYNNDTDLQALDTLPLGKHAVWVGEPATVAYVAPPEGATGLTMPVLFEKIRERLGAQYSPDPGTAQLWFHIGALIYLKVGSEVQETYREPVAESLIEALTASLVNQFDQWPGVLALLDTEKKG